MDKAEADAMAAQLVMDFCPHRGIGERMIGCEQCISALLLRVDAAARESVKAMLIERANHCDLEQRKYRDAGNDAMQNEMVARKGALMMAAAALGGAS